MSSNQSMFHSLEEGAKKGEQEPDETTKKAAKTSKAENSADNKTTITLSILREDKILVKQYAVRTGKTVSDLFHEWIQRYCN